MAFQTNAFQANAFQQGPLEGIIVEMALGGSYRREVDVTQPIGWWRLNGAVGGTVSPRDVSGTRAHLQTVQTVTLASVEMHPEAPYSYRFGALDNSTGGYIGDPTDDTPFDLSLGSAFSVEFWIARNGSHSNGEYIVSCYDVSVFEGWFVSIELDNRISLFVRASSGGTWRINFTTTGTVPNDGLPHHVACSWEGTNAANGVKVWIDGSLEQTTAANTGVVTYSRLVIGAANGSPTANYFRGWLADVAFYDYALNQSNVDFHYDARSWTNVTDDLMREPGLRLSFGIKGGSPVDRVPEVGTADFYLRNDEGSSGGLGYYSPNHVNVRSGFMFGALTRIFIIQGAVERQRFLGRITTIDPEAGRHGPRRTHVVLSDLVNDLINTDLRNVTLQTNVGEDDAILALLEALPIVSQPLGVVLDAGVDTIAYAFSDLGPGARAAQPLADLAISSLGFYHVNAFGVYDYENRLRRQTSSPLYVVNNEFMSMSVPSTLDGVYNRFRLVSRQRTIDAAATRVLFSIAEATTTNPSTISVAPGGTREFWGTYFDPDNVIRSLGGTAGVAPVSTTDYLANASADGTGADKTANITVEAIFFVSTMVFKIVNNDAATIWMTRMQGRGKGLFEAAPVTIEERSGQTYGDRPITMDLHYQSNVNVARDLAQFLLIQYENATFQPGTVDLSPHTSQQIADLVLQGMVGDRFSLIETVNGIQKDVFIHGLALEAQEGVVFSSTIHFSAAVFAESFWILEDADSELGVNTNLGFG